MPDAGIKNEKQYQALLEIGYSKEKAARIATTPDADVKGGNEKPYNEWSKAELYEQARKVGINGRSYMSKKNLIHSLRNN